MHQSARYNNKNICINNLYFLLFFFLSRDNYVKSILIKLKSLFFVCLNELISETAGPNWKILFVLDSPLVEEGYRLYNITLRQIGAEQRAATWRQNMKI